MQTTLAALAVVTVGYIFAYLVFDRLRRRFGYAGSAEYILFGFFLGPRMSGLLSDEAVRELTPIVSLAIGWLGMSLGTYFRLPTLVTRETSQLKVAFSTPVATFLTALGVFLALFLLVLGLPMEQGAVLAATLAAISTLSAPAAIDAFASNPQRRSHPLFPVLQLVSRVDGLIGIMAFGVMVAVFHQGEVAPSVRPPTATEWAVINIAVGVVSGILFHLFLGPREEWTGEVGGSRLFVALAAAIVIASGASYYLNLSPVYTSLILGFILANTGKAHQDARQLLAATERPVYLALLVFAGAAWTAADPVLLFVAPALVGVRLLSRITGGYVGGRWSAADTIRSPRLGRAVLSQGGLAVAVALNYGQIYPNVHPEVVLTAALLSVIMFDLVAAAETAAFLKPVARPETPPQGTPAPVPVAGGNS
ncbi:MAG: hypothetical protein AB7I33_13685 [Gemmatimonadales bacterium]